MTRIFRTVTRITDIFPEAKQVRELGIENYADKAIWEYARANEYTIITFDGDFYDFSLVWGHPPKIIWLRVYNQTTQYVEQVLRQHSETIKIFIPDKELACLEIISTG